MPIFENSLALYTFGFLCILCSVYVGLGFFVTKIRNRMSDKTLDALITMRQYYQKPKKACEYDSDDE